MNREKAKLLLQSYRPGGQDHIDPQFSDALALVEKDPALKQWFEEQRQVDQSISSSLRAVPVPPDLQAKLLTNSRNVPAGAAREIMEENWWTRLLQRAEQVLSYPILNFNKAAGSLPEPPPAPLWRSRPILGIAAGLIVLASLALWWNTRPISFTTLCQEITENAWGLSPHLQFESRQISEVRTWLAAQQVQTKLDLPAGLQNAHLRGCSLIQWRDRKVPVLCLLEGSCHMHLLVVEGLQVADCPSENNPELVDFGLIRTASWSNKDRIFVLTGLNVRTFVKKFRSAGHWNLAS